MPRTSSNNKKVGVVMGSSSDLDTMREAVEVLKEFGLEFDVDVVSCHRAPQLAHEYAADAEKMLSDLSVDARRRTGRMCISAVRFPRSGAAGTRVCRGCGRARPIAPRIPRASRDSSARMPAPG